MFERFRPFRAPLALALILVRAAASPAAEPAPEFFRGINLNGPATVIDGHPWQGEGPAAGEAGGRGVECRDARFENQAVALVPPTDPQRAQMLRSSVWNSSGRGRIVLKDVPAGDFTVFLYFWEDNDSTTFSIDLQGKTVAKDVRSGSAGQWQRLGPWPVTVTNGRIELDSAGGHANLSGIEVWKGRAGPSVPAVKAPPQPPAVTTDKRAGYDWWSLRPVTRPAVPQVQRQQWVRNPIDAFILARLEKEGLAPSPEADRRTLIRRLSFDLTGLPPAPQDVEAFVADGSPDAYEKLVDRLLASPHFGERWARHWLDVVRFGESQGFERNHFRPNAWRYRDWVITALNADLPYDEFVRQQIAGDVLRPDDPLAVAATGFLVCGPYDLVGQMEGTDTMKLVSRQDQLEDFVGALGQTFMGLTTNCARCHDHKFDPITQQEYYQLAATLAGVHDGEARQTLRDGMAEEVRKQREQLAPQISALRAKMEPIDAPFRARLAASRIDAARKEGERANLLAEEKRKAAEGSNDKKVKEDAARAKKEADEAKAELARLESGGALKSVTDDQVLAELPAEARPPYKALVRDASRLEMLDRLLAGGPAHAPELKKPEVTRVLLRGDVKQPADVVAPAGLRAAAGAAGAGPSHDFGLPPDAPEDQRRKRLAEWVADRRNPLTARVIVNRLWHHHLGTGIVHTPNDFGFNGGRPSHPELLDWLASELQGDWSLKKVHRAIVLSAAYRQSSAARPDGMDKDAGNRLLWRKAPTRLEAEALRDAVLAACGDLNPRMGGESFHDFDMPPQQGKNQVYEPKDVAGPVAERRTIYRALARSGSSPLLDTLDCPDPSVATPARTVTTTPLQALSLLNNAFMIRSADHFAARLKREAGEDKGKQIDRAYALAFGRAPKADEVAEAQAFVAAHGMAQFCLVLFNANEFLYVD